MMKPFLTFAAALTSLALVVTPAAAQNLVPGPEYGPPQDWAQLWTPGVDSLKKVIKRDETPWEWTPDGRVRHILNADIPARIC